MHFIEKELIKVTGYKAQRKFTDRQDYLRSIVNAVSKLDDDTFDEVSDEAANWMNAAVEAVNSKGDQEIPDFDEVENEDEDGTENEETEANDETDDDEADDAASDDDDDAADDEDPDEDPEAEDDEIEADEDDEDVDDEDEEPVKKPAKKAAPKTKEKTKPVKAAKAKSGSKEEKIKIPQKARKPDDVVLDRYGCMVGSKNARALAMFEKGATTKEIKETLGGTYYNILRRVVEQGHQLSKEGAVMTLTHKDDLVKKPTKVSKQKVKK